MTEQEFLEKVEHELRALAPVNHQYVESSRKDVKPFHSATCARCRLNSLADEAANRAARVGA